MSKPTWVRYAILIIFVLQAIACETSSLAAATATAEPTLTLLPTDTPTLTPTPTPIPPTETPVPPTFTPRPTFTPTPGPGDIIYNTDFDDFRNWNDFVLQDEGKMSAETEDGRLVITIENRDTYGYALYRGNGVEFKSSDQVIETVAQRVDGTNRNNISLACRVSEKGWYEFSISSGGLYEIYHFDIDDGEYHLLASGGSAAINLQDKPNKLKVVCQDDSLAFIVNDAVLSVIKDTKLRSGDMFGLSVSTFDIGDVSVGFEYYTVRLPNKEDLPLATSTPIPQPTSANSTGSGGAAPAGAPGPYDGVWAGLTSVGVEMGFIVKNNGLVLLLIDGVIPACEDVTPFLFAIPEARSFFSGPSFSYALRGIVFSGTFSGTSASGTLGCPANTTAATWGAIFNP